jgi:hypothetical protein
VLGSVVEYGSVSFMPPEERRSQGPCRPTRPQDAENRAIREALPWLLEELTPAEEEALRLVEEMKPLEREARRSRRRTIRRTTGSRAPT